MSLIFTCETCQATAPSLDGWHIVSVQFLHNDSTFPVPPGGRVLDAAVPDYVFDTIECRAAWCERAGVTIPEGA